jgi:lipopolysaccharide transport system ATP-binding protein
MSDDVLVKVDNVSKRFCRSLKRSLWYGLQDLGSEICGGRHGGGSGLPESSADVPLRPDEFWAVKDVSFALRRG